MDNLKYLRSNQEGWHDPDIVWVQVSAARVKKAADEIERLREALKEVDKALVAWMGENSPIRNVLQDYIKTALKGDE